MATVFPENMSILNVEDSKSSLKTLEDYVQYMQERIDFSISHLRADYIDLKGAITWSDLDDGVQASISAAGGELALQVSNGTSTSIITLKKNGVDISSGTINMTGLVKFSDLSGTGTTTINGSNITTGTISADRISAGSFYMTGGQINIVTSDSSSDRISLNFNNQYKGTMSPNAVGVSYNLGSNWTFTGASATELMEAGTFLRNKYASISHTHSEYVSEYSSPTFTRVYTSYVGSDSSYPTMVHANNFVVHTSTTTSADYCGFNTLGYLQKYASSSMQHKHDIVEIDDDIKNTIKKLYDKKVKSWKFNLDYIGEEDELYDKTTFGLIAEDIDDIPTMCTHNGEQVENYRDRQLINSLLVLVQDLNERLKVLENGTN